MRKPGASKRDDLRAEYRLADLEGGIRGRCFRRVARGSNIVVLDPDVAKSFPDSRAVNQALRLLVDVAARTPGATQRRKVHERAARNTAAS